MIFVWYTYQEEVVRMDSCQRFRHKKLKSFVKVFGLPEFMSLDHDLGGNDTAMVFLHWLENYCWERGINNVPAYTVHSSNPVGRANIIGFLECWKRNVL